MANEKWSAFPNGSTMQVGDQTVGLRGGLNYRFAFPSTGINNATGDPILAWSSPSAAVNYLSFIGTTTASSPIIQAVGTDTNVGIIIRSQGSGNIGFQTPSNGFVTSDSDFRFGTTKGIVTGTTATNTTLLKAYNTNTTSYTTFATLTAGNPPTFDLSASTTIGGNPIAVYPSATNGQVLRYNGSAWAASTNTYPNTATAGQLIYASASNTISGLSIGSTGQVLTVTAGLPAWSTATFPGTVGSTGTILRSDGTNWVATTMTYPNTITAGGLLYGSSSNVLSVLTIGSSGQFLTVSAGVPSWSTATVPPVAGAAGTILRSDGTNWVASTSTYPDTVAASDALLYSTAANTFSTLASSASKTLVTDSLGAISWSATLPSIVQSNITGVGIITSGQWKSTTAPIKADYGGTGLTTVTTGDILIGGAGVTFTRLAIGSTSQVLTVTAGLPAWSTATFPSSAGSVGTILRSDGTNWVATTMTYPNTITSGGLTYGSASNVLSVLAAGSNGQFLTLSAGLPAWSTATIPGTAGSAGTILRSNGTNWVASTATYQNTATAGDLLYASASNTYSNLAISTTGKILTVSAGGLPAWTTATYPDITVANRILYSSSANTVVGLTSANSSCLSTDSTGVPAWTASLTNGQIIIGSTGATPSPATLTGTANQVVVTNGAASITLSLPQSIATGSSVTFGSVVSSGNLTANGNIQLANNQINFTSSDNAIIDWNTTGTKIRETVQGGTLYIQNSSNSTIARFNQDTSVAVVGTLSKGGGSFKIDHPLDPKNKYLYHSFVESPDMLNIYNGIVTLNEEGYATVKLPEYFLALNKDFTYQLTSIGSFVPLFIEKEIAENEFEIGGGSPYLRVSWQVTGVRKDRFAEKNRIIPEVDKVDKEKGIYLHPGVWE